MAHLPRRLVHTARRIEGSAERHWALTAYGVLTVLTAAYIIGQMTHLHW